MNSLINIFFFIFNALRRTWQRLLGIPSLGVKALIINAKQEILLIEHTYREGWHLPGGGVNTGETPRHAIMREVLEETGIQVHQDPILFAVYTHQIMGANDYPILYVVKDFTLLPDPKPSPEIKQVGWFSLDHLPLQTTESTRQRLKEFFGSAPISETW